MFCYVNAILFALIYLQVTEAKVRESILELFPGFRQAQNEVRQHKSAVNSDYIRLQNNINKLRDNIRQVQHETRRLKEAASSLVYKQRRSCKMTSRAQEYRGNISTTKSGKKCIYWFSVFNKYVDMLPIPTINHLNYCRNPDNYSDGPWCYVTKTKWELCSDIPWC